MDKKQKITQQVTLVLIQNIESRDCDITLYIDILKMYSMQHVTSLQLMYEIKNGNVPNYDSITRRRRQIQERNKKLRGNVWHERHNVRQDKAKIELGYVIK